MNLSETNWDSLVEWFNELSYEDKLKWWDENIDTIGNLGNDLILYKRHFDGAYHFGDYLKLEYDTECISLEPAYLSESVQLWEYYRYYLFQLHGLEFKVSEKETVYSYFQNKVEHEPTVFRTEYLNELYKRYEREYNEGINSEDYDYDAGVDYVFTDRILLFSDALPERNFEQRIKAFFRGMFDKMSLMCLSVLIKEPVEDIEPMNTKKDVWNRSQQALFLYLVLKGCGANFEDRIYSEAGRVMEGLTGLDKNMARQKIADPYRSKDSPYQILTKEANRLIPIFEKLGLTSIAEEIKSHLELHK